MAGITSPKSFVLLFMFLRAITFVSSCNEPEAAPAPNPRGVSQPNEPEACDNPEGYPWPEVSPEEGGCGLIVESGLCDDWGCGYYTCEDNCPVYGTHEQGCVWDEWRKKPRCICR
ncbi:hypothetical protein MKX01_006602 [Papaver californicum]|nr:hypothetical protein MKX01_006602 [Papaver californicum]